MTQCWCPKCNVAHEPSQKPMALLLELLAALDNCTVHGMAPFPMKHHDRFVQVYEKCKRAVRS